jgi:hypothetical protein
VSASRLPSRSRRALIPAAASLLVLAGWFCLQTLPAVGQGNDRGQPEAWEQHDVAVLQGLDKITARISTFTAPVDLPVQFGTLVITVRSCAKRPPTETPESAAFLDIDEQPPDEGLRDLFSGWMFASSPALNPLQHPVYDVWLLDCRSVETAPESSKSG